MNTINKLIKARTKDLAIQTFAADPETWLEQRIQQYPECGFAWFLAHAEDEVVWGRVDGQQLALSRPGKLRAATLIECRLFSEQGELLVWREDNGWQARLVVEDKAVDRIDENQLMWGSEIDSRAAQTPKGFTPLIEVAQNGMRHNVPLVITQADLADFRLRLKVRHYLANDHETGETNIALSRLVSVGLLGQKELAEEANERH